MLKTQYQQKKQNTTKQTQNITVSAIPQHLYLLNIK